MHHCDSIRKLKRLGNVVRDEDDGAVDRRLDALELHMKLGSGDRIERAEWFIHQQERRVRGKRSREPDALPLASRQFIRPSMTKVGRIQANQHEQFIDARRYSRRLPTEERRDGADVGGNGAMREQSDVLDDVAGPAPERDWIPFADVAFFNADIASIRLDEAIDQAKKRGFSGAATPDERHSFAGPDGQRHVMKHTPAAAARGYILERHGGRTFHGFSVPGLY
jgi:hypothetical protein